MTPADAGTIHVPIEEYAQLLSNAAEDIEQQMHEVLSGQQIARERQKIRNSRLEGNFYRRSVGASSSAPTIKSPYPTVHRPEPSLRRVPPKDKPLRPALPPRTQMQAPSLPTPVARGHRDARATAPRADSRPSASGPRPAVEPDASEEAAEKAKQVELLRVRRTSHLARWHLCLPGLALRCTCRPHLSPRHARLAFRSTHAGGR